MLGNTRLLLAGSLATVLLLVAVPGGRSECCTAIAGREISFAGVIYTKCGDCGDPTPYCSYGPCDIFGCNCRGGCRHGACDPKRKRRDFPGVMQMADRDNDGRMNLQEAIEYLLRLNSTIPHVKVKRSFNEKDLNSDGYLTMEELDPDSC